MSPREITFDLKIEITPADERRRTLELSERIGELTTDDGIEIELLRSVSGVAFQLRHPNGSRARLSLKEALIYAAERLDEEEAHV